MVDIARRGLLTRAWRNAPDAARPPWAVQESLFVDGCSRCNRCIDACASHILQRGSGGYPAVDFQRGECTFCYACAEACPESLFLSRCARAWDLVAVIGADCLVRQAVECRSCQDSCEHGVITFRPSAGGLWQPRLDSAACTGCGACVAGCPVSVIKMEHSDGRALAGL